MGKHNVELIKENLCKTYAMLLKLLIIAAMLCVFDSIFSEYKSHTSDVRASTTKKKAPIMYHTVLGCELNSTLYNCTHSQTA